MRIIFSRDRPAQLDLLLRSLDRYAPTDDEMTYVMWYGRGRYARGYLDRFADDSEVEARMFDPTDFDWGLNWHLHQDETVTFFCDDDVVFRPVPANQPDPLAESSVLCHSMRLGPFHASQVWNWAHLPRTGHGYPGSIDGHTFRTSDIQEMIADQKIENPTMLETVLALGCEKLADRRPLMAAWPEQVLIGVPVNRVSDTSGCPNGERFPQPVEELNRRFLAGERIALDRLDFSGVDGCHHEIQYEWE